MRETDGLVRSNAETAARERLVRARIAAGSDLHLCEMLLDELDSARNALVSSSSRIAELEMEKSRAEIKDAILYDSAYMAGLQMGFRLGYENDSAGLAKIIEGRIAQRRGARDAIAP